jgi:hypothetical protein
METKKGPSLRTIVSKDALRLFDNLIDRLYAFDVQDEKKILPQLRETQGNWKRSEWGKPLPIIVFYNHVGLIDPLAVVAVLRKSLQDDLGSFFIPYSEHYSHFKNFKAYSLLIKLTKQIEGLEMIPITQPYRLRDQRLTPRELEVLTKKAEKEAFQFGRKLTHDFLLGKTLTVAPEGHHSSDGSLIPAEKGLGFAVNLAQRLISRRKIPEALILSFSLIYPPSYSKINTRLGEKKPITVKVNPLITPSEVIKNTVAFSEDFGLSLRPENSDEPIIPDELIAHCLMYNHSLSLPQSMRGVYDPGHPLFSRVLKNEVQQGIKRDGKWGMIDFSAGQKIG